MHRPFLSVGGAGNCGNFYEEVQDITASAAATVRTTNFVQIFQRFCPETDTKLTPGKINSAGIHLPANGL